MWVILHTWEASWGGGAIAELEYRSRYFNRLAVPSPLSLAVTLRALHPATLTFPHGNAAGMHHQHAGQGGRGKEEPNDSPMWAREWLPVSAVDSNSWDGGGRVWCMTSRWRGFNMHERTAPASADWHSLGSPVHSLSWQRMGAPEGIRGYAGLVVASS